MKFNNNITMTIHTRPRKPGPLTQDEKKQLADFFMAVMELRPKEALNKGKKYDENK